MTIPVSERDMRTHDRVTRIYDRDTRIDVLRALALLTIFIDHVPGTVFENLTYKNLGFSDAAEAFVLIVSCRPVASLTVSGLLWLVAGIWQIAPPNYPEPGFWFLNPLSWQFLFNIGLAAMLHVKRGGTIPVNRWLVGFSCVYVVGAAIWVHSPLWGQFTWF